MTAIVAVLKRVKGQDGLMLLIDTLGQKSNIQALADPGMNKGT